MPKRGFKNAPFKKEWSIVNLKDLERFEGGAVVTPEVLKQAGIVKAERDGVKILALGELSVALTIRAHAFSGAAKEKIEAAGGSAEVI